MVDTQRGVHDTAQVGRFEVQLPFGLVVAFFQVGEPDVEVHLALERVGDYGVAVIFRRLRLGRLFLAEMGFDVRGNHLIGRTEVDLHCGDLAGDDTHEFHVSRQDRLGILR